MPTILIVEYDPEWPEHYRRHEKRIREALGSGALLIEHTGSTSVPGLAAKPIIDITMAVPDSADEDSYVAPLEAAGYSLHIREPHWFEHRLFKDSGATVHLHVFSKGCSEINRMLMFRDWLRQNSSDRQLYVKTKRELAQQEWARGQDYADAKTSVISEILERASKAAGAPPAQHTPYAPAGEL